jgi:transposase
MNIQHEYLYAGIDLHKKYAYITIMDKLGYIQHQGRFNNQEHKLVPTLAESKIPIQAIVESTYGWYWLGEELEHAKIAYVLAHPKKVHDVVGRKKTDKEDSKALADLYRTNLLPTAYVPTPEERSLRELLRFRFRLVEQQGTIKRRLHDMLAKHNIQCKYTDILGKSAKEWLKSLSFSFPYDAEITTLINQSEYLAKDIAIYTEKVREQSMDNKNAKLLQTIPGVGDILSLTLSVEIGNIQRFRNDRALASYSGLVPSVSATGDKTHMGETSSQSNPYIRWALAESITHVIKKDSSYKSFYEKLAEHKGKSKAKVAVMNKLTRAIFVMLTKQVPFRITELPKKETGTKT